MGIYGECQTLKKSVFYHDPGWLPGSSGLDLGPDLLGDLAKNSRMHPLRQGRHHRLPRIGAGTYLRIKRHLAEERPTKAPSLLARSAMTKYLMTLAAFAANEIAHILDDAENRHADLAKHSETLAGIDQRQILRRRDDHGA